LTGGLVDGRLDQPGLRQPAHTARRERERGAPYRGARPALPGIEANAHDNNNNNNYNNDDGDDDDDD